MDTIARDMAKWLSGRGFSVFPIPHGEKRPAAGYRWKRHQTERLTPEQAADAVSPGSNYGIATGVISDLVVLDVDRKGSPEAHVSAVVSRLQELVASSDGCHAPVVVTGSGGAHLYFRYVPTRNFAGLPAVSVPVLAEALPASSPVMLDVRGDGGLVVGPGSVHANGNRYEVSADWPLFDPDTLEMPKPYMPPAVASALSRARKPETDRLPFAGIPDGKRNMTLASLAGTFLMRFPPSEWDLAKKALLAVNRAYGRPPLPEREAAAIVESIARTEHARRRNSPAGR